MKTIIIFLVIIFANISYSQWEECNNGLTNPSITGLAVCNNYVIACTYGSGVFFSSNNGDSWSQRNNGLNNLNISAIAVSGNNIFIGTSATRSISGGIFLSTDYGNNWIPKEENDTLWVTSLATSGSNIIAGTNLGFYISTDNGNTWIRKYNAPYGIYAVNINGNNIYSSNYGLFLSTDFGDNWTEFEYFKDHIIYSIVTNGNNIYVGSLGKTFTVQKYGGLHLSTNNGNDWMYKYQHYDSSGFVATIIISDNKIFIGNSNGVYLSTDNCNTWTQRNNGFINPPIGVWSFAINGSYIFAGTYGGFEGTGHGVFRALLSDFTSVEDNKINPEYDIFPNPASSLTKIRYPSSGNNSIFFYQICKVKELRN